MSIVLRTVGLIAILASLILGWTPVHGDGINCGRVLTGASAEGQFSTTCDDKLSDRTPIVWILGLGGIALSVASVMTKPKSDAEQRKVPWN